MTKTKTKTKKTDGHRQLLIAALEPSNDIAAAWREKAKKGAADSDLKAFLLFVLSADVQDGERFCSCDAGVVWWSVAEGTGQLWFGADDPFDPATARAPDLQDRNLIQAVRDLYGIEKPTTASRRKNPQAPAQPPVELPTAAIVVIENDREHFDQKALKSLAADIRARGIDTPLLVVPAIAKGMFDLVAGERRLRAAKLAGLTKVPVRVRYDLDEKGIRLARLQENLQRQDLNVVEKARAVQQLIDDHKLTQAAAGKLLGCSQGQVANILRMQRLPQSMVDAIAGGCPQTIARDLLPELERLKDHPDQVDHIVAAMRKDCGRDGGGWHLDLCHDVIEAELHKFKGCRVYRGYQHDWKMTAARKAKLAAFRVGDGQYGAWFTFDVAGFDAICAAEKKAAAGRRKTKKKAKGPDLTPEQQAQVDREKKAEQAAALKSKLARYRVRWLQQQIIGRKPESVTFAQGLAVFLHFATSTAGTHSSRGDLGELLGDLAKQNGGKTYRTPWMRVDALPTFASVPAKKREAVAAEWLLLALASDPFNHNGNLQPCDVVAVAELLGVDWKDWRCESDFLQLHNIEQLHALARSWKLKGAPTGKKADVVGWIQEQADARKQPLPCPKAVTSAKVSP